MSDREDPKLDDKKKKKRDEKHARILTELVEQSDNCTCADCKAKGMLPYKNIQSQGLNGLLRIWESFYASDVQDCIERWDRMFPKSNPSPSIRGLQNRLST